MILFSAASRGSRKWHVLLDCTDDDAMIHPSTSCGEHAQTPCCHLQEVLSNLEDGDTVYLSQRATEKHPQCNHTRQVQVQVQKSFTLKIAKTIPSRDEGSLQGVHGISMLIYNHCSESCTVTIDKSHFLCTSLTFNNLNIWIKDSIFTCSFIRAKSLPEVDSNKYNITIRDIQFHSSIRLKDRNDTALIRTGILRQSDFLCISGYWNLVNIQGCVLEGERQGSISGVEVIRATVGTLNLNGVQLSFLLSTLIVSSSSSVDMFNVTDSIFLDNRDGIDIGWGVQYLMVSRSQLNGTGLWFRNWEVPEQCNSAIRGSAQIIFIKDSTFAHNYASGMNCKGAALYLRGNTHDKPLLMSNNTTLENGNLEAQTAQVTVMKSVFYDNMVANCFAGLGSENGGGAIALYGLQLIKITASNFVRNKACKGAGLYIGISDQWLMGYSQNISEGLDLTSTIIIDTCTFNENTAGHGGGLMTEVIESILDTGSSLSTLIYNCSFSSNNVTYDGAGALLHYFNVSLSIGVTVDIKVKDTDIKENTAERVGGGMSVNFTLLTLMSNTSVGTVVNNCTFISNTAGKDGAGICTYMMSCFLYSNSSLTFQIYHSTFASNIAEHGAGVYIDMDSCSLYSNSFLTLWTSGSTFTSNTAWYEGAGIYKKAYSCSLHLHSSLIFQISDSDFTSNSAWLVGSGIFTYMESCSLYSNSFLTLRTSGSTFTSNTAERSGVGVYTYMDSCSLYSNSSLTLQTCDSIFAFNTAAKGVGIHTKMMSCSLHPYSSLTLKASDCTFTSNTAEYDGDGSGIYTSMKWCSLYSNSSLTLQTSHSTFTSNAAVLGAGIYTYMFHCRFYTNSSLTWQTSHSIFTSNAAQYGSGILTYMLSCSAYSSAFLTFQTSHSTFTSNTAEEQGAGIFTSMLSWSLDRFSSFTLQVTDSNFSSNTAGQAAGLGVRHHSGDSREKCVSGQITVGITYCRFLNNSALREGGSLYFKVFPMTQVHIEQSVFEINQALPGSGLYRENIDFPSCNIPTYDLKTQSLITTIVMQCQFFDNIDTAIIVRGKQRFGTLAITKCLFKNNRCIKSLFAEDVFTDINLELAHTKIQQEKNNLRAISINSQSEANLENVTVSTQGLPHQRQISIATFSHYITKANRPFVYNCPAFYKPTLSHSGLTDTGAVMLKAICDSCFEGYYNGKLQIFVSNENGGNDNCYGKDIVDVDNRVIGKNKLCYTNTMGTCIECPHGANCSAGVVSLPNYWGHMTAADRLEFHRCPVGYCCNQAPCEGIAQCAANRTGTLCGQCMKGFTESLITPECIPNKKCNDWWIFPLFSVWTLTITLAIVFSQDILQMAKHIKTCIKRHRSKREKANTAIEIDTSEIELESKHNYEDQTIQELAPKSELREIMLSNLHRSKTQRIMYSRETQTSQCNLHSIETQTSKINLYTIKTKASQNDMHSTETQTSQSNLQSIETQTLQVKTPILWGTLTIQREENIEASGSHKYLQIMLYYLQDAALMQIDLALASTVLTPIWKLRQLLLNVSQLAVELIDLGLNLCPFPGWTPVSKLLTKNLTGPFVFLYIFIIYVIVRIVCWCSPSKGKSIRTYWYPRLTAATIFSILFFYQQIANVAFSLQHCLKSGDEMILFIDGTVRCVQPWQILVFIFTFNWVIGIIPLLMFLPGLLEVGMIRVSHFFLACLMPGPMLLYWVLRFYKKKLKVLTSEDNVTPWHEEALRILQKTFVKTTNEKGLPVCWVGFMKVRRLVLVVTFTFVSNLVARVSLMCLTIVLFMLFHLKTEPYQDDLANKLYTASLLATLAIGFINIMKASCIEFYLDLDKVAHFLTTLNMITDCILVYLPLGFIGFIIVVIVIGKVKRFVQRKRIKQN